jgi:hypothetical protein
MCGVRCLIFGVFDIRSKTSGAIAFYIKKLRTLGFKLVMQNPPAFGQVKSGGLKLVLIGPGASGIAANALCALLT